MHLPSNPVFYIRVLMVVLPLQVVAIAKIMQLEVCARASLVVLALTTGDISSGVSALPNSWLYVAWLISMGFDCLLLFYASWLPPRSLQPGAGPTDLGAADTPGQPAGGPPRAGAENIAAGAPGQVVARSHAHLVDLGA